MHWGRWRKEMEKRWKKSGRLGALLAKLRLRGSGWSNCGAIKNRERDFPRSIAESYEFLYFLNLIS